MRGTLHIKRRFPSSRVVVFSSSSSELGVVGQSTYAAANSFLDELCGGDAIQWGGWAEVGMVKDHHITPLRGERFLAVSRGLQVLGQLLDCRQPAPTLVLDVDWPLYRTHPAVIDEAEGLLARVAPPPSPSPLGERVKVGEAIAYSLRLGERAGEWGCVAQHVVEGKVVCPASAYLSWAIRVLREEWIGEGVG